MSLFYQKSNKIRKKENKECKNNHQATASGGAVYGLGFIGAAIYFISISTSFWAGVLGFLKAIVWPAFLVYEALKALAV
ncbi:MAG: hypothetical protein PHP99_07385 [Paludibacter sp.]|jgi:hypothetical protein|nr:hypothetical protein [Paludibacter sp.]